MTPEERQAKVDFIIANEAEFAAQMEKLNADLTRHEQESKQVHQRFEEKLVSHSEDIDVLRRLAQQFLRILEVEREVQKADHEAAARAREVERQAREAERQAERQARDAEIQAERQARDAEIQAERQAREAERERRKELEGRVDGIEEMTKFLRELLEGNLRPPDKPPDTEN